MENLIEMIEQVVVKEWGREYIIINDREKDKCFKLMLIMPGKMGSLHFHRVKKESFTVLRGTLYVDKRAYQFSKTFVDGLKVGVGDRPIVIHKQILHRFYTIDNPVLVLEESTFHSDDDTYRDQPSRDMTPEEIARLREDI
jgi:mannose-6-phosphate isomerase-like protein (cupin superfamily)